MLGGTLSLATAAQGGRVAWVVPTYKNGRSLWRWAENVTAGIRAVKMAVANRSERTVEFANGGFFGIYSADNEDSIRSEAFHLVILDEAARIPESAWTDAIQPTLADYNGEALLISTPRGLNWFHREFVRGKQDRKYQASWTAPSSNNPSPNIQNAARLAKERVPERTYRQEWLAQFIADGSYFQRIDDAAIIDGPDDPQAHAGHDCVMGADWALSEDYSVFVVVCRDCGRVVDWWRGNQIDYTYQRQTLVNLARKWAVSGVLPERNSIGIPNIELIREHVTVIHGSDGAPGWNMTATSKPGLIQALATAIETGGYKVPKLAADELRSFEVMTTGNSPKFSAPAGQHDDWVIALALAWRAASSAKVQLWI